MLRMDSPTPAPTIPVLITNEPGVIEIVSNLVAPALSILIAGAAVWLTIRADLRRRKAEGRLDFLSSRDTRRNYAEQLVRFLRDRRRDEVRAPGAKQLDEWNDLRHSAPDQQIEKLIAWAIDEYNDLDKTHRDAGVDATLARLLLQDEIEERVHLWVLSGYAKVEPPHHLRDDWPRSATSR